MSGDGFAKAEHVRDFRKEREASIGGSKVLRARVGRLRGILGCAGRAGTEVLGPGFWPVVGISAIAMAQASITGLEYYDCETDPRRLPNSLPTSLGFPHIPHGAARVVQEAADPLMGHWTTSKDAGGGPSSVRSRQRGVDEGKQCIEKQDIQN